MKNKAILLMSICLIGLSASTLARQDNPDCDRGRGPGGHHRDHAMMEHVLDLNEVQKSEIKDIREAHRLKMRELSKARQQNNAPDRTYLSPSSDNFLEKSAERAKERAARMEQRLIMKAQMRADIYALLTDEQRIKLDTFKQDKHKKQNKARNRQ